MDIKKLGEICDVVSGGTPSRTNTAFWDGGIIPWIKIGNIKGKYVSEADEYITQAGLEGSSAKILSKGTVLYTIFATLGEAGILTIDACTNQAIAGITIKNQDEVLADYLYYYLKSKKSYINNLGRGVAQNNINLSILRNLEIPLPALPVQRQTVDILDKTAKVIEYRRQQLQNLDDLVKARFVEMFGDPENNSFDWKEQPLSKHLDVVGGFAFKSDQFVEEGIPVLRIGNINAGYFKPVNMVFWDNDDNLKKYKLFPGDLVMSLTGTVGKDDYGNVCILGNDYDEYYLNQRNAKLELKDSINKYYISTLLKFESIKKKLTGISRGIRQANISNKDILNLVVPIPNITTQIEFEQFVQQIDKSKFVVQQALDKAQLLFDSLMQQYFG